MILSVSIHGEEKKFLTLLKFFSIKIGKEVDLRF